MESTHDASSDAHCRSVCRNIGPLCTSRSRCRCSWGIRFVAIGMVYELESKKQMGAVRGEATFDRWRQLVFVVG